MGKVLILTDGKAGHENQSKAFARALGCEFDLVEIHFKSKLAKALSYLLDWLGVLNTNLTDDSSSFFTLPFAIVSASAFTGDDHHTYPFFLHSSAIRSSSSE